VPVLPTVKLLVFNLPQSCPFSFHLHWTRFSEQRFCSAESRRPNLGRRDRMQSNKTPHPPERQPYVLQLSKHLLQRDTLLQKPMSVDESASDYRHTLSRTPLVQGTVKTVTSLKTYR